MITELDKKVYKAKDAIENGMTLDQIIDTYLSKEEIRVVICNYAKMCETLNSE